MRRGIWDPLLLKESHQEKHATSGTRRWRSGILKVFPMIYDVALWPNFDFSWTTTFEENTSIILVFMTNHMSTLWNDGTYEQCPPSSLKGT
ncbi:hypothetical protein CEXT_811251 [Caerostris extrusa]|uniref:Uncharacterized protein n=1 Tax=Caerostris extrusa TaxID=172846 RepID=A0AAV4SJY9_CAEEX|nr:hypothetical protein CEXT_811251 [Caerostris extrusa]